MTQLVRIEGSDLNEPQFATLISLPDRRSNLEAKWLELFEILLKEPPNMCYPSEDLRIAGLTPFSLLKCQTLRSKDVRKAMTLNYSCSIEVFSSLDVCHP